MDNIQLIFYVSCLLVILISLYTNKNNLDFDFAKTLILICLIWFIAYQLYVIFYFDNTNQIDIIKQEPEKEIIEEKQNPKKIKKVRFDIPIKSYELNDLESTKTYKDLDDYQTDFFTFRDVNNLLSSEKFDPVDKINMMRDKKINMKNAKLWNVYDNLTKNTVLPVHHKNIPINEQYEPYHSETTRQVRVY